MSKFLTSRCQIIALLVVQIFDTNNKQLKRIRKLRYSLSINQFLDSKAPFAGVSIKIKRIVQLNNLFTQYKKGIQQPHAKSRAYPRVTCLGFLSPSCGHRTRRMEPGDLPLLMEAMSNRLIFLSLLQCLQASRQTDCSARPPFVGATCRVSLRCGRTPTAKRCALAVAPSIAGSSPEFPRCQESLRSSGNSAPRFGKRLTS